MLLCLNMDYQLPAIRTGIIKYKSRSRRLPIHPINGVEIIHSLRNIEDNVSDSLVSTVSVDGTGSPGAWSFAETVMSKFEFRIYSGPQMSFHYLDHDADVKWNIFNIKIQCLTNLLPAHPCSNMAGIFLHYSLLPKLSRPSALLYGGWSCWRR